MVNMQSTLISKRLSLAFGLIVVVAAILTFRLFQKQVIEHEAYAASAENQYILKKELPAGRGKIYASDMFPLATNTQYYQVLAVPQNIKNPDQAAEELAPIIDIPKNEIFASINNDKQYKLLKHGLTEEEGDKIAAMKIQGIMVLPEASRVYPEKTLAAQALGFVNKDGDGQYGIEGYFNDELKGSGGEIFAEKDIRGRLFNIGERIDPKNGADYILTIDHNIQYQAEAVLKKAVEKYQADSGLIVIMDPKTGGIYAIAGDPTYDPNKFNEVPQEEQSRFSIPAIASAWEPGSVFKPLIMAAAINEGKVTPETEGVFSNSVIVDSYEIHTATDQAFGKETMTQVLENSDNVAMVWVSEELGKEKEFQYLKDYGFGRKTGIELDTETEGKVLALKEWSNTQRATIAFGQGISVTPVQLVSAMASIANGGKIMKPYIVAETIDANGHKDIRGPQEIKKVLSEETAKKVADMMVSVVVNGHGKKAAVSGYRVAGKTGTAQVPKPGGGYYTDRHIGSFAGFAPADDPKFVMLVRLDQPKNVKWAEESAAPTFGEMAAWLLDYFRVPPQQ